MSDYYNACEKLFNILHKVETTVRDTKHPELISETLLNYAQNVQTESKEVYNYGIPMYRQIKDQHGYNPKFIEDFKSFLEGLNNQTLSLKIAQYSGLPDKDDQKAKVIIVESETLRTNLNRFRDPLNFGLPPLSIQLKASSIRG